MSLFYYPNQSLKDNFLNYNNEEKEQSYLDSSIFYNDNENNN